MREPKGKTCSLCHKYKRLEVYVKARGGDGYVKQCADCRFKIHEKEYQKRRSYYQRYHASNRASRNEKARVRYWKKYRKKYLAKYKEMSVYHPEMLKTPRKSI